MSCFNVIWWDFNNPKPEPYNIMPYLIKCYNEALVKPETYEEFKEFIKKESLYRWWSKCEYEITIGQFPDHETHDKWDIHDQVMMNIDLITKLLIDDTKA